MPALLPKDDQDLHDAFGVILSIESFSDYIIDITRLVYTDRLNRGTLQKVLDEHQIAQVSDIKVELIDLLIVYVNLILNDHIISEKEKFNIEILKKYFRIREGDFYTHRYQEIEDVLRRQLERIYLDNNISREEALHQVELQGLFDLSYDQFDQFKEHEIRRALEQGANITDLDTATLPKNLGAYINFPDKHLLQQVKDLVWNRDKGRCIVCKSNEQIVYDHLIPLAKGGSNTYRNIRLLCGPCQRKNLASIE